MTKVTLLLGDLDLTRGPYSTHVGSSFGGWTSLTSETSSLFLDGSRVSGEASGNRQIVLRVRVEEPSRYGLIEACEALLVEANKQANTLTFSPSGGPDVVYEVFRVQSPERIDDESEAWDYREYELAFPALPFARSSVRESTGALAPAVTLSNFEGMFNGLALASPVTFDGRTYVVPAKAQSMASDAYAVVGLEAVANCLVTSGSVTMQRQDGTYVETSVWRVVAAADGDVIARTPSSQTLTGDVVSCGAVFEKAQATGSVRQVGVEWRDSADAVIRTDWGVPRVAGTLSEVGDSYSEWASAVAPADATAYRLAVRARAATAGQVVNLVQSGQVTTQASLGDTDRRVTNRPFDGAKGMGTDVFPSAGQSFGDGRMGSFIYEALATPVDISGREQLGFWCNQSGLGRAVTFTPYEAHVAIQLYDSFGNWSRFERTSGVLVDDGWERLEWQVTATPDATSETGPANLADVVAYAIDAAEFRPSVDRIDAGDLTTATDSPRGTVYELSPIVGSARTTAQVEVSAALNLTDWLVAAVPGDSGFPMLSIINGVATAPAPTRYEGVYSILGGQAPNATALGTSCTITQKINGATVATKTLTGLARTGGHYVDYGAVALPLVPTPADNRAVSIEFGFAAGSTGEVLVIDVDASLAWVDNLATAMPHAWVDEPEAVASLGKVWVGTQPDRSDARGLTSPPTLSRPLQVKAPSTRLLVYSTTTAPDVELSYYPRWLIEPTA